MIGLHMPNPITGTATSGTGGSRSSGLSKSQQLQHHHHHDNNIIRISARTAPQIVSSVPKCRNPKTSHFYPMETIKGINTVRASTDQLMLATHHHEYLSTQHHEQLNRALMSTSGSQQAPLPKKKGASRKSQPLPLLAVNNQTDDEYHHHQVVLIVNDDRKGEPIIGRRLPSKSMSSSALNSRPSMEGGPPEVVTTTTPCKSMASKPKGYHDDSHPVVGRRSRRFIQQNQQQRAGHIYQYERLSYHNHQEYHPDSHHIATECSSGGGKGCGRSRGHCRDVNYDPCDGEQQPLSIIETQAATSQQVLAIASHHHHQHRGHLPLVSSSTGYKSTKSNKNHAMMLESYNDEHSAQIDGYAKLPAAGGKVRGRKLGPSGSSLRPVGRQLTSTLAGSSTGSSGSSASTSPPSCPAGCPCGTSQPPYPVAQQSDQLASTACDESSSCRHCYAGACQQPSYHHPGSPATLEYLPLARSTSCQRQSTATRRSSCCTNQKVGSPKKRLSHAHEVPRDCCRQQIIMMPLDGNVTTSSQMSSGQRPTRSHISHHHYDYSDNYDINHEPGHGAPSSRPAGSYRSSSCHEPRPSGHHHKGQAPMLISGRNVLPVHPKPVIHAAFTHAAELPPLSTGSGRVDRNGAAMSAARNGYEMEQSPDLVDGGSGVVGQMYESLAAELKAKLGDPKMGPILLPPKDYDTMSRKQGKLTGIELRRSTNPQLVGPAKAINCYRMMSNDNGQATTMAPSNSEEVGRGCSLIKEEAITTSDRTLKAQDFLSGTQMAQDKAAVSSQVYRVAGGSSRSSGRSQDAHDDADGRASLHRSRSNSSSGLGSISMGAGSPNSSPSSKSSSSEDMRQALRFTQLGARNLNHTKTSSNYNTTKIIIGTIGSSGQHNPVSRTAGQKANEKQQRNTLLKEFNGSPPTSRQANNHIQSTSLASPDYCGASDSGHSDTADQVHKHQNGGQFSSNMPSDNHFNLSKFEEQEEEEDNGTSETNNNNNERDSNCANNNNNNDDNSTTNNSPRPKATSIHNPGVVSDGVLWNGRVEIPLKVNRDKNNGHTYLATKQIIY